MEAMTTYDLLAKAQSEMTNPKMRGEAQIGNRRYTYAELSDVVSVVRKALNDNGLFLLQRTGREDDGSLYISTCVLHGDDLFELDREYYSYDEDPQNFGKRETYARRYSLNKAFGLAGEADTDAAPIHPEAPAGRAKRAPSRGTMTKRILQLKSDLIGAGYTADELDSYMRSDFGTTDIKKMSNEQIESYGKKLAELAAKSKESK